MRVPLFIALMASAALPGLAQARDIVPAEQRQPPFSGLMPACDDPAVLSKISHRFASRESTYWASALTIDGFTHVRPIAVRPWGADFVPRRFCTAQVLVSDGHKRRIDYSVREDLGFAGFGWNVEWCVSGLDRNYAYAPGCKAARP